MAGMDIGGSFPNIAQAGQGLQGGVNAAFGNINKAMGANQNTMQSQMMQLQQQLQQQQGQVQQSAVNRGLGNTSVLNTLQQAPVQTYNQGIAGVQNSGMERLMQLYSQLAQAHMQGGEDIFQGALGAQNANTNTNAATAQINKMNQPAFTAYHNGAPVSATGGM